MIPAKSAILAQTRPLRVLVMDDDHERVDAFKRAIGGAARLVHTPSASATQHQLKSVNWDVVFLDHDLELSALNWNIHDHGNGTEVVDYLTRMGPHRWSRTLFIVHSLNNRRGAAMFENLLAHGFHVTRRAHAWEDTADLHRLVSDWEWPVQLQRWDCTNPPRKPRLHKRRQGDNQWVPAHDND